MPFPYIVVITALLGYLGAQFSPNTFKISIHHDDGKSSYGTALIDDDTPIPEHAKFK